MIGAVVVPGVTACIDNPSHTVAAHASPDPTTRVKPFPPSTDVSSRITSERNETTRHIRAHPAQSHLIDQSLHISSRCFYPVQTRHIGSDPT